MATTIEQPAARPPQPRPDRPAAGPPAAPAPAPATPRRKRRRWGRIALIAGAVVLAALLVRAWMPEPIPVETGVATRGPLRVTVAEDGRTRVKDRFVLFAPVSGTLLRIGLHAGDTVSANQVLARIVPLDSPLLDPRARAQTEAQLAAAEAAVAQARTVQEQADAALAVSTRDAARARTLFGAGAVSAQDREQAELAERTRGEEASSARFGVQVAQHQARMYRAALARLAGGGAGRMDVTSPVTGVVLGVDRESEGPIQAGQPILQLGDPAALEVVVDLLTADAARVRPGAAAIIDRWGGSGTLRAHVRRVEPSAFTRISALGVEEQRVNVILDLDDPPARRAGLGDGFRVEASILVWQSDSVLTVPSSALFRHEAGWAVYTVADGRAHLRPVTIGERTDQQAQVLSGLAAGDVVVTYPGETVRDGVRVEGSR